MDKKKASKRFPAKAPRKRSKKRAPRSARHAFLPLITEPVVELFQVMNEEGKIANAKAMPKLSMEQVKEMYYWMVLGRAFDQKMLALQRTGKLGTFASILGQEASNVASAFALEKQDWLFPAFRETISLMVRGVSMKQQLQMWGGDERGHVFAPETNCFSIAVPVATQTLHAVGAAWASKLLGEKNKAFIVYFGDGATSEGDCLEAMNFAGAFKAPVVFFNQNNQWAISVPRHRQTGAKTLAQKAIAFGFEGMQVDGNDVFAVYAATKYALDRARSGGGPTFIESFTYRRSDHTTSDDATRYRDAKEVEYWAKRDPVDRLRKHLLVKKAWSERDEAALLEKCSAEVEKAVQEFLAITPDRPDAFFDYVYEKPTVEMEEQRVELLDFLSRQPAAREHKY